MFRVNGHPENEKFQDNAINWKRDICAFNVTWFY
jgi:hypothetical protein